MSRDLNIPGNEWSFIVRYQEKNLMLRKKTFNFEGFNKLRNKFCMIRKIKDLNLLINNP